jgi:uncharacterized protein (DUF1330 family)
VRTSSHLKQRTGDIHEHQTPRSALRAGWHRDRFFRGRRSTAQSTAAAPAYYVVEVNVRDLDKYKNDYASHVAATLAPYGGRYLAAGGRTESIEGAPPASRVSILEFPSVDKAEAWYNSPDYDKIKPVRHAVATTRSFIVEGRPPAQ